jgi:phospholipase C
VTGVAGGTAPSVPVGGTAPEAALDLTAPFGQFDHLVVLMMENRSFDNMLGYLYEPSNVPRGQHFDGVVGKNLLNVAQDGTKVPVSPGTVMDNPNPDPGEEYPHINTDLFGTVLPPGNADLPVSQMQSPWNAPAPIPDRAPMNGFVQDYINKFTYTQGRKPTKAEYSIIMNCFPPTAVPVISALAKGFAVADHWHCEVPSQTFCNRSFFHAGTSSGFTSNEPYSHFPLHNSAPTVFNRLDEKNVPWRIYFDRQDGFSMTYLIHFQPLLTKLGTNIRFMDDFLADVKNGTLPAYSFVEPRLVLNHNDEHPPAPFLGKPLPSSVLAGEFLIAEVYNAIRTSNSPHGNNWRNTALLITYDEGGGCYDHVSPPSAPPPNPNLPPGEEGFTFNRLGERVPSVLVSAYTRSGTVVNAPLRHTAVVRTMSEKWGLNPLTDRDRTAPTLAPFFNRSTPRPPTDWPTVTPRPLPLNADDPNQPLNELQLAFLGAVAAAVGPPDSAANVKTIGDARSFLSQAVQRKPA